MTDIHRSGADAERFWDELAAGAPSGREPSGDGRETVRRLYQLTQHAPSPQAQQAVDRIIRPLMQPARLQQALQSGYPSAFPSMSPNGALPLRRPPVRREYSGFFARNRRTAVALAAALCLLVLGGGFYLLGNRTEREPPAIPAAVYQEPAETPATSAPMASLVWETDRNPDPSLEPNDVAIAPNGNIWVADGIASNFRIYDRDGALLETWGEVGEDPGQFNFQSFEADGAVAFDANGNIYVADTGNFRIQKFDRDRVFVTSWGSQGVDDGQFLAAADIEVDESGRVFVADFEQNAIQVFDSDGTFLFRLGREGSADGELVNPVDLAIDQQGHVWVVDSGNNRIQVFDANGRFLRSVGAFGSEPGQMRLPHGIAIDDMGRVFIVEHYGYRVQILSDDGESLGVFGDWGTTGDGFEQLEDIAVDDEGGMYITDVMTNRIQKFQLSPLPEASPAS